MKISIVTPTYNQAEYISDTFDSILKQDLGVHKLQYIVVDGLSIDKTPEIVHNYEKRFKEKKIDFRYIQEKDDGQTDAITKGFRFASGEIISYINSDDYYEPNALVSVLNFFEKNSSANWIYGGWNIVKKDRTPVKTYMPKEFRLNSLFNFCNIGQPSCFYKLDFYKLTKGFDRKLELSMDYDLWLQFAELEPAMIIQTPLSNMRYYNNTKSSTRTLEHLSEILKVQGRYTKSNSFQRAFQYYYFLRGLALYFTKLDFNRRVVR